MKVKDKDIDYQSWAIDSLLNPLSNSPTVNVPDAISDGPDSFPYTLDQYSLFKVIQKFNNNSIP